MLPHSPILFPELSRFAPRERHAAVREASRTPFDVVELLAIAAGLVLATALTRYSAVELSLAERLGMALANFVVALPLLALVVVPFHIRRVRRGLREQLSSRGQA
jgi:hypothetical protein